MGVYETRHTLSAPTTAPIGQLSSPTRVRTCVPVATANVRLSVNHGRLRPSAAREKPSQAAPWSQVSLCASLLFSVFAYHSLMRADHDEHFGELPEESFDADGSDHPESVGGWPLTVMAMRRARSLPTRSDRRGSSKADAEVAIGRRMAWSTSTFS